MLSLRRYLPVTLIGLVMGTAAGAEHAWCTGMVKEVSVSADSRRLIVKTEGKPTLEQVFTMNRPARLVIDFKNTRFAGAFKKMRYEDRPIQEVRTASRGKGTRLVIEFADREVPEYRLREIDNHFIILLDEFHGEAEEVNGVGMKSSRDVLSTAGPKPAANHTEVRLDDTDIRIKSARVSNGMIILDVANDRNPERLFRIDLGVDLKELGFSTAEIRLNKRAQQKRSGPTATKKGTHGTSKRSTFVPGSTRLGLGSIRSNSRTARTGLFDLDRLNKRTSRAAGTPAIPILKKCGYKPK